MAKNRIEYFVDPERFYKCIANNKIIKEQGLSIRDISEAIGHDRGYIGQTLGESGNKKFSKGAVTLLDMKYGIKHEDYKRIDAKSDNSEPKDKGIEIVDADEAIAVLRQQMSELKYAIKEQKDYMVSIDLELKKIEALLLKQVDVISKQNVRPVAISPVTKQLYKY